MRWTQRLRLTSAAWADGEVVWSWRPDAGAKLCGSFREVTVAKKPGHRGEYEVSRKPLRRESRDASAEPVCSCAFFFVHFAHETAGAARTRLSLRPLLLRGSKVMQSSDASRRENVRVCLSVTARSEATKQSIPPLAARWIASR